MQNNVLVNEIQSMCLYEKQTFQKSAVLMWISQKNLFASRGLCLPEEEFDKFRLWLVVWVLELREDGERRDGTGQRLWGKTTRIQHWSLIKPPTPKKEKEIA